MYCGYGSALFGLCNNSTIFLFFLINSSMLIYSQFSSQRSTQIWFLVNSFVIIPINILEFPSSQMWGNTYSLPISKQRETVTLHFKNWQDKSLPHAVIHTHHVSHCQPAPLFIYTTTIWQTETKVSILSIHKKPVILSPPTAPNLAHPSPHCYVLPRNLRPSYIFYTLNCESESMLLGETINISQKPTLFYQSINAHKHTCPFPPPPTNCSKQLNPISFVSLNTGV